MTANKIPVTMLPTRLEMTLNGPVPCQRKLKQEIKDCELPCARYDSQTCSLFGLAENFGRYMVSAPNHKLFAPYESAITDDRTAAYR